MAYSNTVNVYGVKSPSFIEKSSTSKKKRTVGLSFPLGKTRQELFKQRSGVELIKDAITQLIKTRKGERIMLPSFGCNLDAYLFQPLDETTFNGIKQEILTSFERYIVGARILKLTVLPLGEAGPLGGNSLKITLRVRLEEDDLAIFDIPITLS